MENRTSTYVAVFLLLLVAPGMVVKLSLFLLGIHFILRVLNSNKKPRNLSSIKAVLIGHVLINIPILLLTIVYFLLFPFLVNKGLLTFVTQFLLFVFSWLWWSMLVPHWEKWAYAHVDDKQKLKSLSMKTGLTWSKDSFFSKIGGSKK
jgi:hypothetical protein